MILWTSHGFHIRRFAGDPQRIMLEEQLEGSPHED